MTAEYLSGTAQRRKRKKKQVLNTFAPQACPGGKDRKSHLKCHIKPGGEERKKNTHTHKKRRTFRKKREQICSEQMSTDPI